MPDRPRVFLDTSVLIAGILSATGGARVILELARTGRSDLTAVREFFYLLKPLRSSIHPTPSQSLITRYSHLIDDPDDRHILAGAAKYRADVLVTHDRRHLMTERLRSADLPFVIQTPGQFLADFRRSAGNETRYRK